MLIESIIAQLVMQFFGLQSDRVWVAYQNRIIPKDTGLCACVRVLWANAKSNGIQYTAPDFALEQSVNMTGEVQVDLFSRDNSALLQYPFLIAMLRSPQATESMQQNSYQIAQIPSEVSNISGVIGAEEYQHFAVRFRCNWSVTRTDAADYYDRYNIEVSDEKKSPEFVIAN